MPDPMEIVQQAQRIANNDFNHWDIGRVLPQIEWRYGYFLKLMHEAADRIEAEISCCDAMGMCGAHDHNCLVSRLRQEVDSRD